MSLCHECGEPVAKIDVYCPFCGIFQKPVVADETVDDALARTIVVDRTSRAGTPDSDSQPESTEGPVTGADVDENIQSEVAGKQSEPNAVSDAPVGEVSSGAHSGQQDAEQTAERGPSTVAQEFRATNEEEPEPPSEEPGTPDITANPAASTVSTGENKSATIEGVGSAEGAAPAKDERFEDSSGADSIPEAGEVHSFEQEDIQPADETAAAPEPIINGDSSPADGTDIDENFEKSYPGKGSDAATELSSLSGASSGDPEKASSENAETADVAESTDAEHSIAKPETELEFKYPEAGAAEFDSVKIIESTGEQAGAPPAIESEARPLENAGVANDDVQDAEAVIDSADDEQSSRPYTSPAMGVGETHGKKSKLKPLSEGTVLNGRYEIVRKIGGGGMGAVYLASDKNLGGVLRAVKEMVQSYIEEQQQEKAINDFKRESLLLTTLEHPAIPTIYDYFFDEKEARFYLVMKYINGGDLASRLRAAPEGRINEKTVVSWALQIADVLDYLHQRQPPIVYRDLKPANIMLDSNTGRVMLIDFGIARWINKEEKGVTAVGTMGYAPPELFSGNVEPRSDIYSLGSTMFQLLTGADPQSNPLLIFDFQKHPRPRQINPDLSDQIERIMMRSVEYNAGKRIPSAADMRRELEEHLKNLQSNRVTFGVKETPQIVGLADENVFCGFCGQNIVASDMFCAFCGAKQPIAQKGVHREIYSHPRLTASLMVVSTNELESPIFTIEKDDNLIGRRDPMSNIFPEVDLSRFDPQTKISRRHARIWRDGADYMVEDLGSSNGTVFVPSATESFRLAPNHPHVLTSGDRLKLGDTTLHFVLN